MASYYTVLFCLHYAVVRSKSPYSLLLLKVLVDSHISNVSTRNKKKRDL